MKGNKPDSNLNFKPYFKILSAAPHSTAGSGCSSDSRGSSRSPAPTPFTSESPSFPAFAAVSSVLQRLSLQCFSSDLPISDSTSDQTSAASPSRQSVTCSAVVPVVKGRRWGPVGCGSGSLLALICCSLFGQFCSDLRGSLRALICCSLFVFLLSLIRLKIEYLNCLDY